MARIAPYGSWSSPITTDLLVENAVRLSDPMGAGGALTFVEGRPTEGGRQVLVRREADGSMAELVPEDFSVRTRVHEYGGLAYALHGEQCYAVNFADQRLYRVAAGEAAEAITPEPPARASVRYAAPLVTPDGSWIICVRERHLDEGVVNELVAVSTSGAGEHALASGHDFYGAPALSPDGTLVAWCSWDHPEMPWDGTELWEARLDGGQLAGAARLVAGGPSESVTQPRYAPGGDLFFVSDRSEWWNLYVDEGGPHPANGRALASADAEFAGPDWVLGLSSYALLEDGSVVAAWGADGAGQLGVLRPGESEFTAFETPYSVWGGIRPAGRGIVAIAASATRAPAVVTLDVSSGETVVVRSSRPDTVGEGYLSRPRSFTFSTTGGDEAYALVYPPANEEFVAPDGERPPLIVSVHGGPTSSASPALSYDVQFWTSRGFAVAVVDYGGSSGHGRAYRDRLRGAWGVVDVADCEHAALALGEAGEADPQRLLIHGGSAGGYTALCATTFGDVFRAGASYYGVADVAALARDTHKFESRYLDGLIGPWPEAAARYEERSPIFHTELMHTPLIVFQGLEDEIVPPAQAELMVAALRDRGEAVAYLAYEGEQHGFRRAENIKRTAEAELYFYGRVLGFEPAGELTPVEIKNAESLGSDRTAR